MNKQTESKSIPKVQYDLRAAKQVERRMFVDAFQRLAQIGFPIRDYQYTGFGGIYFVDFILFHKLLGISKMLTVEHDKDFEDRVRFNCPFKCIGISMDTATDVIPTLSRDLRHILWLDYDYPIMRGILTDVYLAASQLTCGSILIITVDVEPPIKGKEDPYTNKEYFEEEAGEYSGLRNINDFTKDNLPKTSGEILQNALNDGLAGRQDADFYPLFHFLYADGHKMLTIGGVIASNIEKKMIRSIDTNCAYYLRTNLSSNPYQIEVPILTQKERHILDAAMPSCSEDWQPDEFKLSPKDIDVYREIYRFLPAYAELLL